MLRFLQKEESLVGKQIRAVSDIDKHDDIFVMSFEDDTYTVFVSHAGYEDTTLERKGVTEPRDWFYSSAQKPFVEAGVATHEEMQAIYDELVKAEVYRKSKAEEALDWRDYERLKAKFEGKNK